MCELKMVECFRWETGGRSTRWDRFQMGKTRSVHRVHPPCRGAYLGAAAAEAPAQRVGSRTSWPGMPPQELRAARSASTEEARAITGLSPPTAFVLVAAPCSNDGPHCDGVRADARRPKPGDTFTLRSASVCDAISAVRGDALVAAALSCACRDRV